jgi:hypothetical protein
MPEPVTDKILYTRSERLGPIGPFLSEQPFRFLLLCALRSSPVFSLFFLPFSFCMLTCHVDACPPPIITSNEAAMVGWKREEAREFRLLPSWTGLARTALPRGRGTPYVSFCLMKKDRRCESCHAQVAPRTII